MDKLISMTDFVLEQDLKTPIGRTASQMVKYGLFLKQPLTLGMFVPCDDNGNVLEEVKCNKTCEICNCMYEHNLYQEAKERVLFEGGKYYYDSKVVCINQRPICLESFLGAKIELLLRMTHIEFVLTESAKQKIFNT